MYVTISRANAAQAFIVPLTETSGRTAETSLKCGDYLFYEGDEVVRLYQVKCGVLRLTRLLPDGRRQVIAFGYPGDIVGFPANDLHNTDCDALTDVRLQPFRRCHLENADADPDLHNALLQAALREISAMPMRQAALIGINS